MSILLKTKSIEVYDGTTQKNKINVFQKNDLQNITNVISTIETIQNSISDIATIRAGAAKGATAVQSLSGYATTNWVGSNYQQKGDYLTSHQSLDSIIPYDVIAVARVRVGEIPAKSAQAVVTRCYYNRPLPGVPYVVIATPYHDTVNEISGALTAQVYEIGYDNCCIRCKAHDNPSAQVAYVNIFAFYKK